MLSQHKEVVKTKFETTQKGLETVFKPYQVKALEVVFGKDGASSQEIWSEVNRLMKPETISRASIINFMNDMVDEELVDFDLITGKGGHRRIYHKIPGIWNMDELKSVLFKRFCSALESELA